MTIPASSGSLAPLGSATAGPRQPLPERQLAAVFRISAARNLEKVDRESWERGRTTTAAYLASSRLEVLAIRDSGITGPDVLEAATRHAATIRIATERERKRYEMGAASETDVASCVYADAEARFWVEDAKAH